MDGPLLAELAALKQRIDVLTLAVARANKRRGGEDRAPADAAFVLTAADPSLLNASALEAAVGSGIDVNVSGGVVSLDQDPGNIDPTGRGPLPSAAGGTDQQITVKGDMLVGLDGTFDPDWDGAQWTRLPVGEAGSIITPNDALSEGVAWMRNGVAYPEVLEADVTNDNVTPNTFEDVDDLEFTVTSGVRYWFRFVIWYTAAATTTGSVWSINGPTTTYLAYRSEYSLTSTSRTVNEGLSAYDSPAASNASSATTGSNMAIIEGVISPSADGVVIARFASGVSGSAIVAKAGSIVQYGVVV